MIPPSIHMDNSKVTITYHLFREIKYVVNTDQITVDHNTYCIFFKVKEQLSKKQMLIRSNQSHQTTEQPI